MECLILACKPRIEKDHLSMGNQATTCDAYQHGSQCVCKRTDTLEGVVFGCMYGQWYHVGKSQFYSMWIKK